LAAFCSAGFDRMLIGSTPGVNKSINLSRIQGERIKGMKDIRYTTSAGIPHGSMADEFLCHKRGPEWWYATGYLNDDAGNLFTFQFTLAKIKIYGVKFNILMTTLTDFQTGVHHYSQQAIFFGKDVIITPERVGVDGVAEMTFGPQKLCLNMFDKGYSLRLELEIVKPAVWHADDGTLKMGIDDNWTYYWSYTNLAASGKLVLEGKEYRLAGKGWFDRQGGPFRPTDDRTSWEWFSLRFFDNEEAMLFSFPQDNYQDGTFIDHSGKYQRLNDYSTTPLNWTKAGQYKFSFGWQVDLKGIKDGQYTITPKIDGQLNLFYFELLAEIKDQQGKVVGYCFVELLPGVYNKSNPLAAFTRTK
jgi:predicted secreted hydrolase